MRTLAAVCGLLFLTSSYAETVALPDTPAATRLQQLIELMAEATPERVVNYVGNHYTPEYAQRLPLANRIGSFMNWHRRGGMNVVEVRNSQDNRIEVITHQPLTDERWLLGVEVESEPPHRVQALMLGRAPLPPMKESLTDAEVAERWLSYVDELAGAGLFSGAVLIARNDEVLGQQAWGLANRDFSVPNTTETRFNLGSMNKTWTAVAIAQLVEDGKVSFEDPLSKFVDYPNADDASRIRIKHLLTHTSGLGNYFTDEFEQTARKNLRTIDDYLALSADQSLAFEPGTGGAYSNTGMMVLGRVIEVASGQNYFDYIQQQV